MYHIKPNKNDIEIYYNSKKVAIVNHSKVIILEPAFELERELISIITAQKALLKDKEERRKTSLNKLLRLVIENKEYEDVSGVIHFKDNKVYKDFKTVPVSMNLENKHENISKHKVSLEEYQELLNDGFSCLYHNLVDIHEIKQVTINNLECRNENGLPLTYLQILKLDDDLKDKVKIVFRL